MANDRCSATSIQAREKINANRRASIYRRPATVDTPNPASPLVILSQSLCLDRSNSAAPSFSFILGPDQLSEEKQTNNVHQRAF
ncbi:hypothetical protein Q5P01_020627 [Channa striata]|uniref:Uncharacterized protein n=1 Tax=Channa striata TaxID=64152 RepID=A0AA88LXY1_CHASR|nr:hypothetical protein Q5P01_020627 [Channa striata]